MIRRGECVGEKEPKLDIFSPKKVKKLILCDLHKFNWPVLRFCLKLFSYIYNNIQIILYTLNLTEKIYKLYIDFIYLYNINFIFLNFFSLTAYLGINEKKKN